MYIGKSSVLVVYVVRSGGRRFGIAIEMSSDLVELNICSLNFLLSVYNNRENVTTEGFDKNTQKNPLRITQTRRFFFAK